MTPPAQQEPGQGSGHDGHDEDADDRALHEGTDVALGRRPQLGLDVLVAGQPLQSGHVELLDGRPQLEGEEWVSTMTRPKGGTPSTVLLARDGRTTTST